MAFFVKLLKAIFIQEGFSAHFEDFWRAATQLLRNGADRFNVPRDIVADQSIPAGRGIF